MQHEIQQINRKIEPKEIIQKVDEYFKQQYLLPSRYVRKDIASINQQKDAMKKIQSESNKEFLEIRDTSCQIKYSGERKVKLSKSFRQQNRKTETGK